MRRMRDRIKDGILIFFGVLVALAVGLGVGWWLLDVGLRGFLVGFAWTITILLLVGISNTLGNILAILRAYMKGIAEAQKEMDGDG